MMKRSPSERQPRWRLHVARGARHCPRARNFGPQARAFRNAAAPFVHVGRAGHSPVAPAAQAPIVRERAGAHGHVLLRV